MSKEAGERENTSQRPKDKGNTQREQQQHTLTRRKFKFLKIPQNICNSNFERKTWTQTLLRIATTFVTVKYLSNRIVTESAWKTQII